MRRDPVVQGLATMLLLSGMLSLVLCSALAGLQHRQAAQRERRLHGTACDYKVSVVCSAVNRPPVSHEQGTTQEVALFFSSTIQS
ncbi:hypothetical protein HPB48_024014 [Haemaphysalis longicornis]|uniref:Uncharacterized protein n=1 Tax=Haemaphysalis longicornis TaxID=44386 RepID=A0A9J6H7E0_HAELO|nr:hypothetical protein HPB48_024014 [Haemaphysalis longicornis]